MMTTPAADGPGARQIAFQIRLLDLRSLAQRDLHERVYVAIAGRRRAFGLACPPVADA